MTIEELAAQIREIRGDDTATRWTYAVTGKWFIESGASEMLLALLDEMRAEEGQ